MTQLYVFDYEPKEHTAEKPAHPYYQNNIHNRQVKESAQLSLNRGMYKNVVYAHNGVLLNL